MILEPYNHCVESDWQKPARLRRLALPAPHAERYIIKRIYQMLYLHQTADGLIHECNGEQIIANDKSTYLVWTKCEIDVPENKSFKSNEVVTCYKCLQA